MKTRVIHTKFWNDDIVASLSERGKLFFLYLLTNQYINLSGAYEIPERVILFETNFTKEQLEEVKKELTDKKRALFYDNWVIVPRAVGYNGYLKSSKMRNPYLEELKKLPENVVTFIQNNLEESLSNLYTIDVVSILFPYSMDTTINNKSKIIKRGVWGEQKKRSKNYSSFSEDDYPYSTLWDVDDYAKASADHKEKIANAIRGGLYQSHEGWVPPENTPAELVKLFTEQNT